jgi:hypothetical protein
MTSDLLAQIRDRQDGTEQTIGRQRGWLLVPSYPVLVGCVIGNSSIPAKVGTYVAAHPVDVLGTEAESALGVLFVDVSRTFLTYIVGSSPPMAGDYLICRFVGNRWVAARMSATQSTGVVIPGCPCGSSPSIIHMSSSNPSSNNHMFQTAVLTYGPTPASLLTLGLGSNSYLSTTTFPDLTTGDQFRYNLSCYNGFYVLTRVYDTSVYGSPYRDMIRYFWPMGYMGNTCKPFLLARGQMYTGGDPSCVVTISA